jgi:hypothetical protein
MSSTGLVTAGFGDDGALWASHLWGETVANRFLDHSYPLNGPIVAPGCRVQGYFAVFFIAALDLWAGFASFIGAVDAVGRTIRPSLRTAA